MVQCTLHIHVSERDRPEFRDGVREIVLNFGTKFLLRRGECKTREISISGIRAKS